MILAVVLIPAAAGLAAFAIRGDGLRRWLTVAVGLAHAGVTARLWMRPTAPALGGWIALDRPGLLFLSITSLLFLAASIYGVGYLIREGRGERRDIKEGFLFTNAPEQVFAGCLMLFLATMSLVTVSHHFGLLWVAVEATTLASAPLIYFHRHHRSLEATWKYLLIGSVGIAVALLGNFCLNVAASRAGGPALLDGLVRGAASMDPAWLKAAFLCFLVGYGTKMGLAPMHSWLPDAHTESPSLVSSLLSGALLNCAFLGILRSVQVCDAAGLGNFARELLVGFGLLSMGVAGVFILRQADYKRMLAYSSVEHMGILALGVGIGGAATFGAMLHAVNHSVTKAMLFFVSGNILAAYRTRVCADVRGVVRTLPASGVLWLVGFLAITGSPPFGTFLSEFTILKAALDAGRGWVAAAYLALLALVFVGMAAPFLNMAQGSSEGRRREGWLVVAPPIAFAALALLLGLWLPARFVDALRGAAREVEGLRGSPVVAAPRPQAMDRDHFVEFEEDEAIGRGHGASPVVHRHRLGMPDLDHLAAAEPELHRLERRPVEERAELIEVHEDMIPQWWEIGQ
ncbi:MAG: NADH dehydrogenase FAD-containing subunit [Planctomycetes bacterium]|nr:NADH dehydrogenase FAD-containing subunit [Planctomycetota bacterium]